MSAADERSRSYAAVLSILTVFLAVAGIGMTMTSGALRIALVVVLVLLVVAVLTVLRIQVVQQRQQG